MADFGASWGRRGVSWGVLGASWGLLGASGGVSGPSWRLLGRILEPTCAILKSAHFAHTKCPRLPLHGAKMGPRWLQNYFQSVFEASSERLEAPRRAQDGSKTAPRRPRTPLDAPKSPPRRPKTRPGPPQDAPRTPRSTLKIVWEAYWAHFGADVYEQHDDVVHEGSGGRLRMRQEL